MIYICKLNPESVDNFTIPGVKQVVHLDDKSSYHYTLWTQGKMHLYLMPSIFQNEALDLVSISLMVFYADRTLKRSLQSDSWTREFTIYMPVLKRDKWNASRTLLERMLTYLTGDIWHFEFRQRILNDYENNAINGISKYHKSNKLQVSQFCMLSGGLDSFIGAIDELSAGHPTIFVGNYNGGKGVSIYQDKVINLLKEHFQVSQDTFYQFYAAPIKGSEDSTRSRSFMFFSHAILLASCMRTSVRLIIPENGVISLNIPLTVHRSGSLSTRTTHPYYMGMFQCLLDNLSIDVTFYNPYQFMTKGEMLLNCQDQDFLRANIKWTMSCSHPDLGRYHGDSKPSHCGICLPCSIRRAALYRAGFVDKSKYRDCNYSGGNEAMTYLKSYKLGLIDLDEKLNAANLYIDLNGPIRKDRVKYEKVYKHGLLELKAFLDQF